jgi:hypothetical protein
MIESCMDGVNWVTRDTCDEEQIDSALEALDLFDDCAAKYRVFDMEEQLVVRELPKADGAEVVQRRTAALFRNRASGVR